MAPQLTTPRARIRLAIREDAHAVAQLYARLHEEQWIGERGAIQIDWLHEVENALADRHTTVLVADVEGVIVGTVRLEFATRPYGRVAEVRRLYVVETWRRRGIATRLMESIEELASSAKVIEIRLTLLRGNSPAQGLYERRGYQQFATRLRKAWGR
jgi:GNAT superfamily N-acetyltransferase